MSHEYQRSIPVVMPAAVIVPAHEVQVISPPQNGTYHQQASCAATSTPSSAQTFLQQCQTLIPAQVRMISGCEDEQTAADVSNLLCTADSSLLPNPFGRAGGACTSALLDILYRHHNQQPSSSTNNNNPSFQQVLMELRQQLHKDGHSQIPQLSSSRPLDLDHTPFRLGSCNTSSGRQRALLVGIRYHGQSGELRGCHNDVRRMRDYLVQVHGVPPHDILVLMDDDTQQHHAPTRANMIRALRHLVAVSQPGDSVVFHYSGHGGLLMPEYSITAPIQPKQKHKQTYDQTLLPLDHRQAGHVRDFHLFHHFVQPMKAGVTVTCIMDCCHSGSVLELPYSFLPTKTGRGRATTMMEQRYSMQPQSHHLTNLAFLYLLAGGGLPSGGILDGLVGNLQDTLGENDNLQNYQGAMNDELQEDIAASGISSDAIEDTGIVNDYDYGGDNDVYPQQYGDIGGADDAAFDTNGGDDFDSFGGADNIVGGRDVADDTGGGGWGEAMPGGDMDDGAYFGDTSEGCGDEGCGDLLSSLVDCLGDQ